MQAYELSFCSFNVPTEVTGNQVVEVSSMAPEVESVLPGYLDRSIFLTSVKTAAFNSCSHRVGDIFVASTTDDMPDFASIHNLLVSCGTLCNSKTIR